MKYHLPLALFCIVMFTGCAQKQATIPAVPSTPDGNVGTACTSHEECQTPGEYLLRSSCPFTSRCIAQRCAVVCPSWEVVPDGSGAWTSSPVVCRADADCHCTFPAIERSRCACIEGSCMAVMR